ncbi:MAG: response regulator [Geobacteraceae bacterium]|nr:response regulator [Geobacteraceae bacterium]
MSNPPRNGVLTVMIVDDSEVARNLLRDILEECGYTVIAEAADGVEAVAKYDELRPLVTIMDVKMPRKDGIEATREILALNGDARVLICSSADHDSLIAASAEARASGVIYKPFILEQIVAAIEAVL